MAVERLDIAKNLLGVIELVRGEHLATHQEGHGALRIHDVGADASVEVFLLGDIRQDRGGILVGNGC